MTHEDPHTEKPRFVLPRHNEIVEVLRNHPLIRLKEKPIRTFIVGSFAGGTPTSRSDVDVLLEVAPRQDMSPGELEEKYRDPLRRHFMENNIRGVCDRAHPQWCGRRVDVYFTYNADLEVRPKIELEHGPGPTLSPQTG